MQSLFYEYDFSSLSPAQRLELAEELVASVRSEAQAGEFSVAEMAQMQNEMEAIRNGSISTVSWESLKKRLLSS